MGQNREKLPQGKLQFALEEFEEAHRAAAFERAVSHLTGRPADLLSYEEVAKRLRVTGRSEIGQRSIPVAAIVGSVGRYNDFTRTFLPRVAADADRWAGVRLAANVSELPPIEVYQIGEAYFVLDGNHRVSIARRRGKEMIDARVTEVHTRVPLSPGDSPDELIIKTEYAAFLDYTHLRSSYPDADLLVTVPGQYATLENLIEVYRFFVEMEEEAELGWAEAVTRWYEEAYLPVIRAVRQQNLLSNFPGRTETDFYIWVATHRAELRNRLGWEIGPQEAATRLAEGFKPLAPRGIARFGRRILDIFAGQPADPAADWTQERLLARYSENLFANILLPVVSAFPFEEQVALAQALKIAGREQAQILGLLNLSSGEERPPAADLREQFAAFCQQAAVSGALAIERGEPIQQIGERAHLVDLIVLEREAALAEGKISPLLRGTLSRGGRPILLAGASAHSLQKVFLFCEAGVALGEALFVAAYLGEEWGLPIVILAPVEDETVVSVKEYLAVHDLAPATIISPESAPVALVRQAGGEPDCLVIAGAFQQARFRRHRLSPALQPLVTEWDGPLLICP